MSGPFLFVPVCPKIARRCRRCTNKNGGTGVITMSAPTRPTAEIVRLGKEIYERDIRSRIEDGHHGEYVAIDVESGEWAVASSDGEALGRLRAQHPGAVDLLMEHIGYRALHSFGAGSLRVRPVSRAWAATA